MKKTDKTRMIDEQQLKPLLPKRPKKRLILRELSIFMMVSFTEMMDSELILTTVKLLAGSTIT